MNRKQAATLKAIFAEPTPPNVRWSDVEALLRAVGCGAVEGAGSAVKFEQRGMMISFHRPHPSKEAKRYQVRDARAFLIKIGVVP